jgi:SAM-dependent methyltransferase
MKMIKQLAKKHGSQKAEANFEYMLDGYEKHLPEKCDTVLEIGCFYGGFTKALQELYKCDVHVIDLFHPRYTISFQGALDHGFIPHQGDQGDIDFLKTINNQFDLIVEDGSHHSDDQINTFKHLFENNLKPGGLYVLEDLHCCVNPYWWRSIEKFEDTFLGLIKSDNIPSDQVSKYELINDSIAFFYKK